MGGVADPDLFTSNPLFGQPGLYPPAAVMTPADGRAPDEQVARSLLGPAGAPAVAAWDDPTLVARTAAPLARAAAAALAGSVAAPLLAAFLAGATPVRALGVGVTASPGRVVGPPAAGDPADPADRPGAGTGRGRAGAVVQQRVVNERYAAEHPLSVAPSVAHDLGWSGPGATHAEETVLHLIVALVHAGFVARQPHLAHLGTELVRRQNSLVLPLLCSRQPGSAMLRVVAPEGTGTAPGGAASMQTPDFWSIPFAPPGSPTPLPAAVAATLTAACGDPAALGDAPVYNDELGVRLSAHGFSGALPLGDQLRVAVALGLVGAGDLAAASGLDPEQVGAAFGVAEALACFAAGPSSPAPGPTARRSAGRRSAGRR